MITFKTFNVFALTAALLLIAVKKGHAAAVTLYDVPAPLLQFPSGFFGASAEVFAPLLSESFSVIGTGSNGATLYQVEEIRTAEVVYGASTTFTQAAPTLPTTIPVVFTMEQDATHIHVHVLPTTVDSHWIILDTETDCTMDINKSTGACKAANPLPETVVTQGATPPAQTISTTLLTWTGAPTPIATITQGSGSTGLRLGASLGGIIVVAITSLILQI